MIKFFKNIRKQIIFENRSIINNSNYFKYALGEIVLVVIGILIALQINNWNEDRKLKRKETLILQEFLNSINSDLEDCKNFFDPRLERKKSGLDSLLTYVNENRKISDSLFIYHYRRMSQDFYLRFDNGPFEALKSSGLDLIRNDSLRTEINKAYTSNLPSLKHFSESVKSENNLEISKLEYKILSHVPVDPGDDEKKLDIAVKEVNILKNQDFLWILDLEYQKYFNYTMRLKQMRNVLNSLKANIEKELSK